MLLSGEAALGARLALEWVSGGQKALEDPGWRKGPQGMEWHADLGDRAKQSEVRSTGGAQG